MFTTFTSTEIGAALGRLPLCVAGAWEFGAAPEGFWALGSCEPGGVWELDGACEPGAAWALGPLCWLRIGRSPSSKAAHNAAPQVLAHTFQLIRLLTVTTGSPSSTPRDSTAALRGLHCAHPKRCPAVRNRCSRMDARWRGQPHRLHRMRGPPTPMHTFASTPWFPFVRRKVPLRRRRGDSGTAV